MRHLLLLISIVLCFSFIDSPQDSVFGQLSALTGGTWTMKTRRGLIGEQWQKKDNRHLSGRSFLVAGTDTSWQETLTLSADGNEINYISQVNGQNDGKAIPFKLTSSKEAQFIFENPTHDFPQRIVYHFINKDSVHAWIDGKINGQQRKSDFYYSRKN